EHEAASQVLAHAEAVGEVDVGRLLLLGGVAVRVQVVAPPDLEQRPAQLLRHELVVHPRGREVQGEGRGRPGPGRACGARYGIDPPEAGEPDLEVLDAPARLARATLDPLERAG